jgi:outer membrane protein insertion porin family
MTAAERIATPSQHSPAAWAPAVLAALSALALLLGPGLSRAQQGKEMVSDVIIDGARSFTPEKAMRYIQTRKNRAVSKATVQDDVDRLQDFYHSNGYLLARISRELKFSDDFQSVKVIFHIREGQRFRIKSVSVEGTKDLPAEVFQKIIEAKSGEFYNANIVQADARNIAEYFGWRGYRVKVDRTVSSVPGEPGVVTVQYNVEASPVKVSHVEILPSR